MSVYICVVACFHLVFLSFVFTIEKQPITKNKNKIILGEYITNNISTLFPSRNLRGIYSRSGPGLDILYVLCYVFLEAFLFYVCLFLLCFLFSA